MKWFNQHGFGSDLDPWEPRDRIELETVRRIAYRAYRRGVKDGTAKSIDQIKDRLPVCVCAKHNHESNVYDEWYEWWCPVHGKKRI